MSFDENHLAHFRFVRSSFNTLLLLFIGTVFVISEREKTMSKQSMLHFSMKNSFLFSRIEN